GVSYRDLEEIMEERRGGIETAHMIRKGQLS
ncbi:hypothetical protein BMETH_1721569166369, partial [methanotrophic bacterial endosymbiont of Bathymodiolus sp.]